MDDGDMEALCEYFTQGMILAPECPEGFEPIEGHPGYYGRFVSGSNFRTMMLTYPSISFMYHYDTTATTAPAKAFFEQYAPTPPSQVKPDTVYVWEVEHEDYEGKRLFRVSEDGKFFIPFFMPAVAIRVDDPRIVNRKYIWSDK